MNLELIDEAVRNGARLKPACEVLGINARTVQRWRAGADEDRRCGPQQSPSNKLSDRERQKILDVVNSPEFRDLSPNQIVPRLADRAIFLASEATIYRILREEGQLKHRERSKAPVRHRPTPHVATGPEQVASWDITYLKSPVRGCFFYLYMVEDVWSRKILGWAVHEVESNELAAELIERICKEFGIDPDRLVLHADNGGPMKGATMLATMQRLGVMPSFSRPSVSNDNPYSESLFRTLKYRPEFPTRPFASIEEARAWVATFVTWYNTTHLHSGIRFVTPDDRHYGREKKILAERRRVYERARRAHPERWSGTCRDWTSVGDVYLNPEKLDVVATTTAHEENAMAA